MFVVELLAFGKSNFEFGSAFFPIHNEGVPGYSLCGRQSDETFQFFGVQSSLRVRIGSGSKCCRDRLERGDMAS